MTLCPAGLPTRALRRFQKAWISPDSSNTSWNMQNLGQGARCHEGQRVFCECGNPGRVCARGNPAVTLGHGRSLMQMVWESGCVVIVMLTPLSENGVRQCYHYWPDEGSNLYHVYEVLATPTTLRHTGRPGPRRSRPVGQAPPDPWSGTPRPPSSCPSGTQTLA